MSPRELQVPQSEERPGQTKKALPSPQQLGSFIKKPTAACFHSFSLTLSPPLGPSQVSRSWPHGTSGTTHSLRELPLPGGCEVAPQDPVFLGSLNKQFLGPAPRLAGPRLCAASPALHQDLGLSCHQHLNLMPSAVVCGIQTLSNRQAATAVERGLFLLTRGDQAARSCGEAVCLHTSLGPSPEVPPCPRPSPHLSGTWGTARPRDPCLSCPCMWRISAPQGSSHQ